MTEEVDLGLNRLATILFTTTDKMLIVMGEVDIGLRTATLPPINQVILLYYWYFMLLLVLLTKVFMLMKEFIVVVIIEEMDLGLKRPATLPFTIV